MDLYLPKELKQGTRIPAILSQTRYWRSLELTWLAKLFAENKINKPGNRIGYIGEIFPMHGYAWLDVDVRGTGASGGSRAWDLSPIEISDGNEIVNWIINQPWSNGRVGATGLSYSSETSERLLINQNPAVKAVAARFNPFDFYEDLAFPGGVPNVGFFTAWGKIERELDNNIVPSIIPKKDAKFLKGVKLPQSTSGNQFRKIISYHHYNYDFAETMKKSGESG